MLAVLRVSFGLFEGEGDACNIEGTGAWPYVIGDEGRTASDMVLLGMEGARRSDGSVDGI